MMDLILLLSADLDIQAAFNKENFGAIRGLNQPSNVNRCQATSLPSKTNLTVPE